jgi:hypothetical protein
VAAHSYRESRLPPAAPEHIQRQGLALLDEILGKASGTPFGQSVRGQVLAAEIRRLMDRGLVVFVTGLGAVGKYIEVPMGRNRLLIDTYHFGAGVSEDKRYVLPDADQVARAAFHEAVHSLRRETHCTEEECDGMLAAFQADAALSGSPMPVPALTDGSSVAEYVRTQYADLPHDADYRPVGLSRDEFERAVGW